MRQATVEKLKIERKATVDRIAELEAQQAATTNPKTVKRRNVTIKGQRERIKMIDRLIEFKESEHGKE